MLPEMVELLGVPEGCCRGKTVAWPCEDGGIYTKRVHPNPSGFRTKLASKMFLQPRYRDVVLSRETVVFQLNKT